MQVRKRLVIYVQGYDPRGLAEYYRMFRREYRRACELYGLAGKVDRAENDPERFTTAWDVTTNGDGWQVETHYLFLRWEDIVRQDFARPVWWKIVHLYRTWAGIALFNGVLFRILKAHWRFGVFLLYVPVLMTVWLLLGAFVGILCMKLAASLGAPLLVSSIVGAVTGIGAFSFMLRFTEPQTYLLYLCDDGISACQFAHRQRPDWEARMETFSGYVVEAVRTSNADETIIVGHSSGSFLAVDVLDRALALDPALGRHGPHVRLLTIGANLPIIGFHAQAQWFRDRLRRLAVAPDIDWVDFQSRKDVMSMFQFDPIRGHGIELGEAQRNPLVVTVRFRDIIKPETYARFRWRFFRTHFQYLLANERLGVAYDYYLICCGPLDLMTAATKPEQAIASMGANKRPDLDPAAAR